MNPVPNPDHEDESVRLLRIIADQLTHMQDNLSALSQSHAILETRVKSIENVYRWVAGCCGALVVFVVEHFTHF